MNPDDGARLDLNVICTVIMPQMMLGAPLRRPRIFQDENLFVQQWLDPSNVKGFNQTIRVDWS